MAERHVIDIDGLNVAISKTKEYADYSDREIKSKVNNMELANIGIKSKTYQGNNAEYAKVFDIQEAVQAVIDENGITGEFSIKSKTLYLSNIDEKNQASFKMTRKQNGEIIAENYLNAGSSTNFGFNDITNWELYVIGNYKATLELEIFYKTKAMIFGE